MPLNLDLLNTARDIVPEKGRHLSTGHYPVYAVPLNGDTFVLKDYGKPLIEGPLHKRLFASAERGIGGLNSRLRYPSPEANGLNIVRLETTVLNNWRDSGIHAPIPVAFDSDSMLLTYVDGKNYLDLLHSGEYTVEHHAGLLNRIQEIRATAFENDDPYFLHNDMTLANFMYSGGEAIPIDPGLLFRKGISVSTLDTHVNLFMAFSLLSPCFGYKQEFKEVHENILEDFIGGLDNETRKRMLNAAIPVGNLQLKYLQFTAALGINKPYYNFMKTFSPDVCDKIKKMLTSSTK